MIELIAPKDRKKQIALYNSLTVGKDGMFSALFGLAPGLASGQVAKEALLAESVTSDPTILQEVKENPAMRAELIAQKKAIFEKIRDTKDQAVITQGLDDGAMTGYRTLSILHYMHKHPGVTFMDAMDPAKDVQGKHEAAMEVIDACAKTSGITTETRGTSTAKIVKEGTGDDMIPIVAGAIQVLNSLDVRDIALQMMEVQPPTTPEQAKTIFTDPQNQSTVRPVMSAISDFYTNAQSALYCFGVTQDQKVTGLRGRIRDGVFQTLTEQEREQWALTQQNLPYLQSEQYLHKLRVLDADRVDFGNKETTGEYLDQSIVAEQMIRSATFHERIAETGTLAAMDADPQKTRKQFESLDHSAVIFGDEELTPKEIIGDDGPVKKMLGQGLPEETRREITETLAFTDVVPEPPTARIRKELAQARTPAQMESVLEALGAAAPGLIHEDGLKGMKGQARLTSNCDEISYVDPDYQPAADGKQVAGAGKIQTIAMLKPEVYNDLRGSIEKALDLIDKGDYPNHQGFADRYQAERAKQDADPVRAEALGAGKTAMGVLSGITQDRVQAMEDLYSRMKDEQSRLHRDSDTYKEMYRAVEAIHERASKGYDPKDPAAQAEMSKLFTKAYQTAQAYSDKEVAGKEKKTQRGLDRKNFTLTILTNTSQHRDGASTWYLPEKFDERRLISEDPKAKTEGGIDGLLKEEKRHNRSFREFLTGKNPFSKPLARGPKKEITRKPVKGKKTNLQKLMELEKAGG
nr:hypothetical protein [Lachnospiraceae bacterium]